MTAIAASPTDDRAARPWRLRLGVAAGLVLLVLVLVLLAGRWSAAGASLPGEASPAVGFARDMAAHHAQAVAMAEIMRERTTDADLRLLATDIALTQQSQIGRMRGWLDVWGLRPTGTAPRMAWMGEPRNGLMPGMATATDIERLRTAPIADAEALFLTLMIDHHLAGVAMAEGALRLDTPDEVEALARGIVTSQRSEVEILRQLLADRGRPAGSPGSGDTDTEADHQGAMP